MAASGGVSSSDHWEERYHSGDTPWDKGVSAPALMEFLAKERMEGRVLVPGCGAGHDVRAIAEHGAEVVGLDFATKAIEQAQKFPLAGRESYIREDFFHLPPAHRHAYDWVFEHTCFCAIDPQRRVEYVGSVASALRDGGRFLAVFFLNPDHDEDGPPYGVSLDELDEFFNGRFELLREWRPAHYFPGRENREMLRLYRKKAN